MSSTPRITAADRATLSRLLVLRRSTHQDVRALVSLSEHLKRAVAVRPEALAPTVVTLGSRVRVRAAETGDERVVEIVVPGMADPGAGRLSVLTPVGIALLGQSAGDRVEVAAPAGRSRFTIVEVLFQPESAERLALAA